MEWGYDRRIPINTGVFLDVEVVKAIIDLRFNPGEGVAHLNLAAKGLSILSCQGRTTGEIERLKEREEALTATKKTHQLDEFLRLQKDQRRTPADNFLNSKITLPHSWASSGCCLGQTVITKRAYGMLMPQWIYGTSW